MRIHQLLWSEDRIEHIARHDVSPNEVEEVCFSDAFVRRARSKGKSSVYYVLGQTNAGRHAFPVIIEFPDQNGFPITARPMTDAERWRFQKWQRK